MTLTHSNPTLTPSPVLSPSFHDKRTAKTKTATPAASGNQANAETLPDVSADVNLATVTHDLATPLSIIAGAAWSLKADCCAEDREFWVDCILRNAMSAQNLVEDFKDDTCDRAGKLEMQFEELELDRVVREAVDDFAPLSRDHHLTFHGDSAWIRGDAERLRRLIFNLLSNAVKYSQSGSEIKIDVWRRGARVCVFVQDQGRGVSHTDVQQMFQPFVRLEADKNTAPGDGLGLASVKRIADAHGAFIGVRGIEGQGTIFQLSFKALDRTR